MTKVKELVSITETIEYLNQLLEVDPDAINALFSIRIACSEALANHPTVQVGAFSKNYYLVGMLGVLNGLFGTDQHKWGHICMDCTNGRITGFRLLSTKDVARYVAKNKEEGDR